MTVSNPSRDRKGAFRKLLILALLAAAVPQIAATAQRSRKPDAKKEAPRGPYTLFEVLEGLKSLEPVHPGRMAELLGKHGATFTRGPEITGILKDAGAPDALLALIPEPPAPPAPKIAGDLTVGCAPRDCEIVIDARYEGPTKSGRKTIAGLPPGEVEITVFSDGYTRAARRIKLEENKPIEEAFTLEPSQNTRIQLGAKFALETFAALGGLSGTAETLAGTADMTTPNGVVQYKVQYKRPVLEVTGPNTNCIATMSQEGIRPQCKGKAKPGVLEAVEQLARVFWAHDVITLLDQALKGNITAEAWRDARRLSSETPSGKLILQINADHLPVEIEIQPKQGPPEKVLYTDYAAIGKVKYPKNTVILKSGKPQAEFHFH